MSEELSAKTCVPCRGGIPPLTKAEAEGYLAQVPKWTLQDDGKRIERSFSFDNFQQALDFVVAVGRLAGLAHRHDHTPPIGILARDGSLHQR